jgi:endonuclease/exonuclease/phosphatase family metal-dependent hydrolase
VLTLNVWNLSGERGRQQLLHDGITNLQPDLISLQEVTRNADYDQLAELLAGTGLHGVHQLDLLDPNPAAALAGTALASRWQPRSVDAIELPVVTGESGSECAIAATVPLPTGIEMLFIAVKPTWRLDGEADRVVQARAIAELDAKLRCAAPTIIAGDFDATPDSDSMRYLTGEAAIDGKSVCYHDVWAVAGDGGPGHTWTFKNPFTAPLIARLIGQPRHARRIDHILVGSSHAHPHVAARVRCCELVLTDPPASDHYGVLAVIDIEDLR